MDNPRLTRDPDRPAFVGVRTVRTADSTTLFQLFAWDRHPRKG